MQTATGTPPTQSAFASLAAVPGLQELFQQLAAGNLVLPECQQSEDTATNYSIATNSSSSNLLDENGTATAAAGGETVSSKTGHHHQHKSSTTIAGTWFRCFEGSPSQVNALMHSLYVMHTRYDRHYAIYECINRHKHKCPFAVRVHAQSVGQLVAEEKGEHSHSFDSQGPLSSQGLPRAVREVVDRAFREEWTAERRQSAVLMTAQQIGLDEAALQRLQRQIDNRLSYLRRTRNLTHRAGQQQLAAAAAAAAAAATAATATTPTQHSSEELALAISALLPNPQTQEDEEEEPSTPPQTDCSE